MTVITCRFASGSSPLARGTLQSRIFRFSRRGLIPARAGNTACYLWASGWTGAHPRSRGEHMGFPSVPSLDMGSSPPVRGAHVAYRRYEGHAGLIPACAGSTPMSRLVSAPCWAHPRLCGEHANEKAGKRTLLGSSPPVRGARLWLRPGHHLQGLIPACAGSTKRKAFFYKTASGSSPPVRGAQPCSWRRHQDHGLIPACAGSTDFAVFDFYPAGAHPRLCGEHCKA